MHRKQKYLFLFLLFFCQYAFSQSVLWSVQDSSNRSQSYLFGSAHIAGYELKHWCDKAEFFLDSVDVLIIEADVSSKVDPKLYTYLLNKTDYKLKDYLSKEEYNYLDSLTTENVGLGLVYLEKVQPIILSAFLEMAAVSSEDSFFKMEEVLVNAASARGKEFSYFETVEEQLGFLSSIPFFDQLHILKSQLHESDDFSITSCYNSGDIDGLDDYSSSTIPFDAYQILIKDRNLNMVKRIMDLSKAKSSLFVVGAAHLGGKDGILQLLKKSGLILKPIQ